MDGGIISVLVGGRGRGAVGEKDGRDGASALELAHEGGKRLDGGIVQEGGEGAALGDTGADGEGGGGPAIEEDASLGAGMEELHPAEDVGAEAKPLEAALDPTAVHAIVGLAEVQEEHTAGLLNLVEVVKKFEVEECVVPNPPVRQKGCLGDVGDVGKGPPDAIGDGLGQACSRC